MKQFIYKSLFRVIFLIMAIFLFSQKGTSQQEFEKDVFKTNGKNLEITFIGHGTLMFQYGQMVIHVDPVTREADYSKMPVADFILITHEHGDHLDPDAIKFIRTDKTAIVLNEKSEEKIEGGIVMKNGDTKEVKGIEIAAVPAYNIEHKRPNGQPFHPKGIGNGYVFALGNKKIYIAGDTENIPEMEELKNIDIAFLPMNLPYTMTPEMVADAARTFRPKILYPYHFGETDTDEIIELLKNEKDIEVRIRKME
jgi:L-ascorbate metabolism protein UlaG (beta-lactamase superfamily)